MRQFPAEDLFGGARRLDAIGIGLNLLVQNFSGRRLVRLAESGCRVAAALPQPGVQRGASGASANSASRRGELSRAVEMNILHMRRVRSRLRDPGAFEIQVFDETPRFTAYLVDGDGSDGLAVVQSVSAPGARHGGAGAGAAGRRAGWSSAGAGGQESGLFPTYREEFESAWADSRPVS